jgi:hypothetical protein
MNASYTDEAVTRSRAGTAAFLPLLSMCFMDSDGELAEVNQKAQSIHKSRAGKCRPPRVFELYQKMSYSRLK